MPLAFALTLIIGMRGLASHPLSNDEFASLDAVQQGLWSHAWELPLVPYYGVLWLWTGAGRFVADEWLRGLSLLAICAAAAITSIVVKRLVGNAGAYLSGVLFAMSAGAQNAAQDARPYALSMALSASALLLLTSAAQTGRRRLWAALSVVLVIDFVILPVSVLAIAPLALIAVGISGWRSVRRPLSLSLTPVLALAATSLLLENRYGGMHAWLPRPMVDWLPQGFAWLGTGDSLAVGAGEGFAIALLVVAATTRLGRLILLGLAMAVLTVWLVSQGSASFWVGRTFLPLFPLLIVAASIGMAQWRLPSILVALGILALIAIPDYTAIRTPRNGYADLRGAAIYVMQHAQPGDQVLGDPREDFGLWAGLRHYGDPAPGLEVTAHPTGEFWMLYGDAECAVIEQGPTTGNVELRRCAGLPAP